MIWERFAHEMLASVKHASVTRPVVQQASQAPGLVSRTQGGLREEEEENYTITRIGIYKIRVWIISPERHKDDLS